MKSRPWCSGVRNRQVFPLALPLAYGNSERRGCRLASRPLFFTGFPSVSHLFPARENNAALGRDQSQTSARAEQPSNGKQTILRWDRYESVLRCTIREFIFFPRYVARQLPSRRRTDPPATLPRPFQPDYGTPFSLDTNGDQRAGARHLSPGLLQISKLSSLLEQLSGSRGEDGSALCDPRPPAANSGRAFLSLCCAVSPMPHASCRNHARGLEIAFLFVEGINVT